MLCCAFGGAETLGQHCFKSRSDPEVETTARAEAHIWKPLASNTDHLCIHTWIQKHCRWARAHLAWTIKAQLMWLCTLHFELTETTRKTNHCEQSHYKHCKPLLKQGTALHPSFFKCGIPQGSIIGPSPFSLNRTAAPSFRNSVSVIVVGYSHLPRLSGTLWLCGWNPEWENFIWTTELYKYPNYMFNPHLWNVAENLSFCVKFFDFYFNQISEENLLPTETL